jgi:hypothetical protein
MGFWRIGPRDRLPDCATGSAPMIDEARSFQSKPAASKAAQASVVEFVGSFQPVKSPGVVFGGYRMIFGLVRR